MQIPEDVLSWVREAFAEANRAVAETLVNVPNIRETSLDDCFVQALVPRSAPTLLASGAVVRMDIHNIGGLRRIARWETADIGIVVFIVRGGKIVARKVAFLQAKRLMPTNNDIDDADPTGFRYGLNSFLNPDPNPLSMALARRFDFTEDCLYGAVKAASEQVAAIDTFHTRTGTSVDYLFYNPPDVPLSVGMPAVTRQVLDRPPVLGCRVVPFQTIHSLLAPLPKGRSLSLADIRLGAGGDSHRIENWASDLLLRCKVGRPYEASEEDALRPIFERRSGPIGAAIAINVQLPTD